MNTRKNNLGFGLIPLILVIALISLLVLAGVRITNKKSSDSSATTETTQPANDLKSTSDELDSVKLDEELDTAELDQDIQAVL